MKAMLAAGENDARIAGRVELFLHRVPEEFYDFQNDPDALRNLVGVPRYRKDLQRLRRELQRWMQRTNDPALEAFENVDSFETQEKLMNDYISLLGGRS